MTTQLELRLFKALKSLVDVSNNYWTPERKDFAADIPELPKDPDYVKAFQEAEDLLKELPLDPQIPDIESQTESDYERGYK